MTGNGRTSNGRSRGKKTPDDRTRWLDAFREQITVAAACRETGIGRSTVYEWRASDPVFAAAWSDIDDEISDALEGEAYRRAVEGVSKPVYQGGKKVGDVQHYSDRMLEMLLRARRPERFRDRVSIEDDREAQRRREIERMTPAELDDELTGLGDNVVPLRRAS